MSHDQHEPGAGEDDLAGTVAWRDLLAETASRLDGAEGVEQPLVEARWICQDASGLDGAAWETDQGELATVGGVARLDAMVARRLAGEPIQYVLGHWPFRHLDLLVDRRVLIPWPETEQVVTHALAALDRLVVGHGPGHRPTVADLGTGSGAIALSIASERAAAEVWATDRSPDALAVARANLAALGMAGSRVRLVQGDWFAALPDELRGALDLVVANPPYVRADEPLPSSVVDWEPIDALVPGPTGLESYETIVAAAPAWLAPGGALVLEIGADQAAAVAERVAGSGLIEVTVEADLAGRDRAVLARRPG